MPRKPAPSNHDSHGVPPGSLILVYFVERQLEGWTFDRSHWPLHITIVPWFATKDEEAVMRSLDKLAAKTKPFSLAVGGEEKFGSRHNIPVNVIRNQDPARDFHERVLYSLEKADIELHESRFTGGEYKAHITRHAGDGRHSNEGENVLVNNFHLVRLINDKTLEVYQEFNLTGRS